MSARLAHVSVALLAIACHDGGSAAPLPSQPSPPDRAAARLVVPIHSASVILNGQLRVPVAAYSAAGDSVPLPGVVTFVSRAPDAVSVDAAGLVTGLALGGQTWIVASVTSGTATLADSMRVTVACTSDLRTSIAPTQATLQVGDTLAMQGRVLGCLGQIVLDDTLVWSSSDSTVARVDPASGVVTARAPGAATVSFMGQKYHAGAGAAVTVLPRGG
ncbi:MAG: Ig-like domain-containing protein [Gemmatirosa sp.]|nr:Ig-like domain-containing protein [Gemmatirosa sp.]